MLLCIGTSAAQAPPACDAIAVEAPEGRRQSCSGASSKKSCRPFPYCSEKISCVSTPRPTVSAHPPGAQDRRQRPLPTERKGAKFTCPDLEIQSKDYARERRRSVPRPGLRALAAAVDDRLSDPIRAPPPSARRRRRPDARSSRLRQGRDAEAAPVSRSMGVAGIQDFPSRACHGRTAGGPAAVHDGTGTADFHGRSGFGPSPQCGGLDLGRPRGRAFVSVWGPRSPTPLRLLPPQRRETALFLPGAVFARHCRGPWHSNGYMGRYCTGPTGPALPALRNRLRSATAPAHRGRPRPRTASTQRHLGRWATVTAAAGGSDGEGTCGATSVRHRRPLGARLCAWLRLAGQPGTFAPGGPFLSYAQWLCIAQLAAAASPCAATRLGPRGKGPRSCAERRSGALIGRESIRVDTAEIVEAPLLRRRVTAFRTQGHRDDVSLFKSRFSCLCTSRWR